MLLVAALQATALKQGPISTSQQPVQRIYYKHNQPNVHKEKQKTKQNKDTEEEINNTYITSLKEIYETIVNNVRIKKKHRKRLKKTFSLHFHLMIAMKLVNDDSKTIFVYFIYTCYNWCGICSHENYANNNSTKRRSFNFKMKFIFSDVSGRGI